MRLTPPQATGRWQPWVHHVMGTAPGRVVMAWVIAPAMLPVYLLTYSSAAAADWWREWGALRALARQRDEHG